MNERRPPLSLELLMAHIDSIESRLGALQEPLLSLVLKMQNHEKLMFDFAATFAGQQIAITAILRKLDEQGALPAQEAKVALEGALASLSDDDKKGPQGTILRQLIIGTTAGATDPTRRH
jgi:hypothetical protein